MARKRKIDVVVIPDASPVLSLARLGRLDLLTTFNVPIRIVDQVHYEITKPENDTDSLVTDYLQRQGNCIEIVETTVGLGFKVRRDRGEQPKSSNLG